jgi:hypothetical protein
VDDKKFWNFTCITLIFFLFSFHCLHEKEKFTSSMSLLQRNHRRGMLRIVESLTMTQENTPFGEILTSKVTFSRFYMYLTLRAVNVFIDRFRL